MPAFYLSLLETQEDKDKFERLYEEFRPLMKSVAYDILQDAYLAEDAVQNVFLNMIKHLYDVDESDPQRMKRLFVVSAENAARDILRYNNRVQFVDYEKVEPILSVTPDMLGGVAAEDLVALIRTLPAQYRDPLEMKVLHHMSEKQIADVLGIRYAAARKRLERARALLFIAMQRE